MKVTKLLTILAASLVMVSGSVYADNVYKKNAHEQNMLSKRPYQPAPDVVENSADEKWQGATLVTDDPTKSVENKGADKHQQMRINMLGKRPYAERNTD